MRRGIREDKQPFKLEEDMTLETPKSSETPMIQQSITLSAMTSMFTETCFGNMLNMRSKICWNENQQTQKFTNASTLHNSKVFL